MNEEKKIKSIIVTNDVHTKLINLKKEKNVKTINNAIEILLTEYEENRK